MACIQNISRNFLSIGPGHQLQCLPMKCPGCGTEMTAMMLDGRLGKQIIIDVCAGCQAFWFDLFESLQLSAGSTLNLMKFIGEHSTPGKAGAARPSCPATASGSGTPDEARFRNVGIGNLVGRS